MINGTENNYQTFQGQEEEKELGKNTYAYQWRDYDPAIARFNKIDRFAEKYYGLTPYHFTANNPIRFIEVKGDYITIGIHDGDGNQVYSVLYENGKAYHYSKDENGNITKGDEYDGELAKKDKDGNIKGYKGDLGKTVRSLNKLSQNSKTAKGIISYLQESNHETNIRPNSKSNNHVFVDLERGDRYGVLNNNAYFWQALEKGNLVDYAPFSQIGSNNRLTWNPSTGIVGLGHELAHSYDAVRGLLDSRRVKFNGGIETVREIRAMYFENMIRKDLGKSLRKRYRDDGPVLVGADKNPLFYVNSFYINPSIPSIRRGLGF